MDTGLVQRVRRVVRRLMWDGPGSHGFDHVRRVLGLCRRLGREAGADLEVLTLAALLHDVGREEERRSGGEVCHARAGARDAASILRGAGAPPRLIRRVAACVRQHRFRGGERPDTLEARILFDADKIDSLGAVGVGRAFLFAGEVGARLHNTPGEAGASTAYSREDTAHREFLRKLRKIPARMLTSAGGAIARERLEYMEEFFRRLTDEEKGGR